MDRNPILPQSGALCGLSLSARRAWIEMGINPDQSGKTESLSARRAWIEIMLSLAVFTRAIVALRKESVDRNVFWTALSRPLKRVALRKESVDRNPNSIRRCLMSVVALRKESVDRNVNKLKTPCVKLVALRKESVDRNYIIKVTDNTPAVALRKESVDRNVNKLKTPCVKLCRSPQGERG